MKNDKANYIKGAFWGATLVVMVVAITLGVYVLQVVRDGRHIAIIHTDNNCIFMDAMDFTARGR